MNEQTIKQNQTKRDFNKCPHCGGTSIERDRTGSWFDEENQTLAIEVHCENCAKDFEEIYRYTGFRTPSE